MHLIELYKSVQGESSFAGLPCIFVRLAGCNLRCAWCDSEYTFTGGKPFTEDQIVDQIEAAEAPCKLVEFTGGEPMLQAKELLPLMQRLLDTGYTLMIETSGERPLAEVPKAVHKIVDVKCPGAGAAANSFRMENLDRPHQKRRSKVRPHQPRRLRLRPHLHPRARSQRKSQQRPPLTRLQQIPQPAPHHRQRHPRPPHPGRMDDGRRHRRPPLPPDPQIHLGAHEKGRLTNSS